MFKAVILLARAEGATRQEFRDWWLGPHAELARDLPGLRRLVFNLVETEGARRSRARCSRGHGARRRGRRGHARCGAGERDRYAVGNAHRVIPGNR